MAEVIKDLGLIDMIDVRLVPNRQEEITPGEAVAGMIRNGLGFANRPLSLTPQFFANTPLDLLCREGVGAEMCNRFKLGRTRDEVYAYGCDRWFRELALAVGAQEGLDWRFNHLDTTSVSLSGESVPDSDARAMTLTHGYAKDHRPDLTQAVWELMVSHDGGIPCVSQSGDGHASDTEIFQERAAALIATLQRSPTPRYLVADAQRYTEANAANLPALGLITRMPHTLKLVSPVITPALPWDTWPQLDDTTRDQRVEFSHYGMTQRWLVVSSEAAVQRTEATISQARPREAEAIAKQLFHLPAKRFETPQAAQAALDTLVPAWTYHQVETYRLIDHKRSTCKGCPTPTTPIHVIAWQIQAQVRPDDEQLGQQKQRKACVVVGTTIDASQLSDAEVIRAYKGQAQAEGGFRLLNDPRFFVASLLVKKPCRIQGLLMVMT